MTTPSSNDVAKDVSEPASANPLKHWLVIGISALVSWLVATGIELYKSRTDELKYFLDVDKIKIDVVNLVKDRKDGDVTLALAIIDYYTEKYKDDNIYNGFLIVIRNVIGSDRDNYTNQPAASPSTLSREIASITVDQIQAQFGSANRRRYAEFIAATAAKASDQEKKMIADQLIKAILSTDNKYGSSYRINIYITLTFSLLPPIELSRAQVDQLLALKNTGNYDDPTFRLNLSNALARQGISS